MWKYFLLLVVATAAVQPFEIKSPIAVIKDVKGKIVDGVGGMVGEVAKIQTAIPLFLSQGASGAGDWLAGIADKFTKVLSDVEKLRRKTLLERYNEGVMHRFPETTMKFPELVRYHGYPVEEFEVKTEDGYILQLFRIPHGKHSLPIPGIFREPVFLQHGLIDSSDDWVIMGPSKGLAYILADAGYDVWLGNARGNTYSKRHVNMTPKDVKFWDFSWDEIGRFDLPAMIDQVLATTGKSKLYYVGHSQGTTSYFVMCSMRPEYNAKIRIMFALAPIAWMDHMVSPMIRLISPGNKFLEWVAKELGVGEFLPNSKITTIAGGILCKDHAITQDICSNSLFLVCGFDVSQMNTTMLPIIAGHSPAGSSVKQFLHYAQGLVSKDFRRYDFGLVENKKRYGQLVPPSYPMDKVTSPVALYYSTNDWLSHPTDVTTLSRKLGNMVDMYLVPNKQFNHMDYMWAVDVDNLVYKRLMETLRKY